MFYLIEELPSEEDSLIDQDSHQTTETTVPVSNAPPKAVGLCRALRIPVHAIISVLTTL